MDFQPSNSPSTILHSLKTFADTRRCIDALSKLRKILADDPTSALEEIAALEGCRVDEVFMGVWDMHHKSQDHAVIINILLTASDIFSMTSNHLSTLPPPTIQSMNVLALSFLSRRLKSLYYHLSSQQRSRSISSLQVLASMASLGPSTTRELVRLFDFSLAALPELARPRKGRKGETATEAAERQRKEWKNAIKAGDVNKQPTRAAFIRFVLALIKCADVSVLAEILQIRPLMGGVLNHLASDPPEVQIEVLNLMVKRVIGKEGKRGGVGSGLVAEVFSDAALGQLAVICESKDVNEEENDAMEIEEKEGDERKQKEAQELAFYLLNTLVSSSMHGLAAPDHLISSYTLQQASNTLTLSTQKRLLRLLLRLRPATSSLHYTIFQATINHDPALAVAFLLGGVQQAFNMEPQSTGRWLAHAGLIGALLDRVSNIPLGLAFENTWNGSLPGKDRVLQGIMKACFPSSSLSRAALSRGVQHGNALVRYTTLNLIAHMLKAFEKVLEQIVQSVGVKTDEAAAPLASLYKALQQGARSALPDLQPVLAQLTTIQSDLKSGNNEDEDSTASNAALLSVTLRTLCLWHRCLPDSFQEGNVDVEKLIPTDWTALEPLHQLQYLNLVSVELLSCGGRPAPAPTLTAAFLPVLHLLLSTAPVAGSEQEDDNMRILEQRAYSFVCNRLTQGAEEVFEGLVDEAYVWIEGLLLCSTGGKILGSFLHDALALVIRRPDDFYGYLMEEDAEVSRRGLPVAANTVSSSNKSSPSVLCLCVLRQAVRILASEKRSEEDKVAIARYATLCCALVVMRLTGGSQAQGFARVIDRMLHAEMERGKSTGGKEVEEEKKKRKGANLQDTSRSDFLQRFGAAGAKLAALYQWIQVLVGGDEAVGRKKQKGKAFEPKLSCLFPRSSISFEQVQTLLTSATNNPNMHTLGVSLALFLVGCEDETRSYGCKMLLQMMSGDALVSLPAQRAIESLVISCHKSGNLVRALEKKDGGQVDQESEVASCVLQAAHTLIGTATGMPMTIEAIEEACSPMVGQIIITSVGIVQGIQARRLFLNALPLANERHLEAALTHISTFFSETISTTCDQTVEYLGDCFDALLGNASIIGMHSTAEMQARGLPEFIGKFSRQYVGALIDQGNYRLAVRLLAHILASCSSILDTKDPTYIFQVLLDFGNECQKLQRLLMHAKESFKSGRATEADDAPVAVAILNSGLLDSNNQFLEELLLAAYQMDTKDQERRVGTITALLVVLSNAMGEATQGEGPILSISDSSLHKALDLVYECIEIMAKGSIMLPSATSFIVVSALRALLVLDSSRSRNSTSTGGYPQSKIEQALEQFIIPSLSCHQSPVVVIASAGWFSAVFPYLAPSFPKYLSVLHSATETCIKTLMETFDKGQNDLSAEQRVLREQEQALLDILNGPINDAIAALPTTLRFGHIQFAQISKLICKHFGTAVLRSKHSSPEVVLILRRLAAALLPDYNSEPNDAENQQDLLADSSVAKYSIQLFHRILLQPCFLSAMRCSVASPPPLPLAALALSRPLQSVVSLAGTSPADDPGATEPKAMLKKELCELLETLLDIEDTFGTGNDNIDAGELHAAENALLPVLMAGYGGSMSVVDRAVWSLATTVNSRAWQRGYNDDNLEDMDTDNEMANDFQALLQGPLAATLFAWGPAAVAAASSKQHSSLLHEQILSKLHVDPARCVLTAVHFPEWISLFSTTTPPGAASNGINVVLSGATPCLPYCPAAYDPSFLLPFCIIALRSKAISPRSVMQSGLLAVVMRALAAEDPALCALGYEVLGLIKEMIASPSGSVVNGRETNILEDFRERSQLSHLLFYLSNSITQPFLRIPSLHALYLAEATLVIGHPTLPLYPIFSKHILKQPTLDFSMVPSFIRPLLNSGSQDSRVERQWVLRLLLGGLRNGEDAGLYRKQYIFELLMALYDSTLSNLPVGNTSQGITFENTCDNTTGIRGLCLEVVCRASAVPRAARALAENSGLILWLNTVIVDALKHGNNNSSNLSAIKALKALENLTVLRSVFGRPPLYNSRALLELELGLKEIIIILRRGKVRNEEVWGLVLHLASFGEAARSQISRAISSAQAQQDAEKSKRRDIPHTILTCKEIEGLLKMLREELQLTTVSNRLAAIFSSSIQRV